jgi:hypothetical protein
MLRRLILKLAITVTIIAAAALWLARLYEEKKTLETIIERLSADSRIAEVIVTDVRPDPLRGKALTTIKFLEYDTHLKPLAPRYFSFFGNIIQFQSMVIRFDDFYVRKAHPLKGKSAYIFMKAFSLGDDGAQVFQINSIDQIPSGYVVEGVKSSFQKRLWEKFWEYALSPEEAKKAGVKNAQIEAPGTKFIPGILYTIKIEHDGGMRIDAQPLPQILKGETIG